MEPKYRSALIAATVAKSSRLLTRTGRLDRSARLQAARRRSGDLGTHLPLRHADTMRFAGVVTFL
jgi:hypothetical protein